MNTDRDMIFRSFEHLANLLGEELAHAHAESPQVGSAQVLVRWTLKDDDARTFAETTDDVLGVVERTRIRAAYEALAAVRDLLRERVPTIGGDPWPEAMFRTWTFRTLTLPYAELACEAEGATEPTCRENLAPVRPPADVCAMPPRDAWVRPATRLLLTARDLIAALRLDRTTGQ